MCNAAMLPNQNINRSIVVSGYFCANSLRGVLFRLLAGIEPILACQTRWVPTWHESWCACFRSLDSSFCATWASGSPIHER